MKFYVFNKSKITSGTYRLIGTGPFLRFMALKFFYLLMVLAATAGLLYFHHYLKGYTLPAVFILGMYISLLFFRMINYVLKFRRFKGGSIEVSQQGFEIKYGRVKIKVRAGAIVAVEKNVLGNLVVREKAVYHPFPISLLSKEDRKELLGNFS